MPETIHDLARAGVKIWVLTGDKQETAINIGVACQLLQPKEVMEQVIINSDGFADVAAKARAAALPSATSVRIAVSPAEIEDAAEAAADAAATAEAKRWLVARFERELYRFSMEVHAHKMGADGAAPPKPRALIIDGESLLYSLQDDVKLSMLAFAKHCKAVIGCRVSPIQKRQMVELVRFNVPGVRTLSIGDGANDVPMLQGAHVGVGISGQEGMQAVNNSDFAIAQFKYLRRLLLVHGRWNYRRSSKLVCYIFYKNVLLAVATFWYAMFNAVSGQKIFCEMANQGFNIFFTAMPIILLGVYDRDVEAVTAEKYPRLYTPGMHDAYFNAPVFWSWVVQAFYEGLLFILIPLYAMPHCLEELGMMTSLWEYGAVTFTIIVLVASLKIALNQYKWNVAHIVVLFASIVSWFVIGSVWGTMLTIDWDFYMAFPTLLYYVEFWLCVIFCVVAIFVRDFTWKAFKRLYTPSLYTILQESENLARRPGADPEANLMDLYDFGPLEVDDIPTPDELEISGAVQLATIRAAKPSAATTSPLHPGKAPRRGTVAAMHPAGWAGERPLRHPHAARIAAPEQADDREHHDLGFAYSNDEASHQNELSKMVSRREPKK